MKELGGFFFELAFFVVPPVLGIAFIAAILRAFGVSKKNRTTVTVMLSIVVVLFGGAFLLPLLAPLYPTPVDEPFRIRSPEQEARLACTHYLLAEIDCQPKSNMRIMATGDAFVVDGGCTNWGEVLEGDFFLFRCSYRSGSEPRLDFTPAPQDNPFESIKEY